MPLNGSKLTALLFAVAALGAPALDRRGNGNNAGNNNLNLICSNNNLGNHCGGGHQNHCFNGGGNYDNVNILASNNNLGNRGGHGGCQSTCCCYKRGLGNINVNQGLSNNQNINHETFTRAFGRFGGCRGLWKREAYGIDFDNQNINQEISHRQTCAGRFGDFFGKLRKRNDNNNVGNGRNYKRDTRNINYNSNINGGCVSDGSKEHGDHSDLLREVAELTSLCDDKDHHHHHHHHEPECSYRKHDHKHEHEHCYEKHEPYNCCNNDRDHCYERHEPYNCCNNDRDHCNNQCYHCNHECNRFENHECNRFENHVCDNRRYYYPRHDCEHEHFHEHPEHRGECDEYKPRHYFPNVEYPTQYVVPLAEAHAPCVEEKQDFFNVAQGANFGGDKIETVDSPSTGASAVADGSVTDVADVADIIARDVIITSPDCSEPCPPAPCATVVNSPCLEPVEYPKYTNIVNSCDGATVTDCDSAAYLKRTSFYATATPREYAASTSDRDCCSNGILY
jgi:hypothetical protein